MSVPFTRGTAVLIFANSPSFEAERKELPFGQKLLRIFNDRTIQTVERSGLPFFLYNEGKQRGRNFGDRFSNAIEDVFSKGYNQIITIGNDSPGLQLGHLTKALEQLKQGAPSLGPSSDGGFYLMAVHKEYFNREAFMALPWQETNLRQDLQKLLEHQGAIVNKLEVLQDIDSWSDLESWFRKNNNIPFSIKELLTQVFTTLRIRIGSPRILIASLLLSTNYNKGSPVLVSC